MNSWIAANFDVKTFEFFNVIIGPNIVGIIRPNINDMLEIFFTNHNEEIYIERTRINLIMILTQTGGFANIVILSTRLFSFFYAV